MFGLKKRDIEEVAAEAAEEAAEEVVEEMKNDIAEIAEEAAEEALEELAEEMNEEPQIEFKEVKVKKDGDVAAPTDMMSGKEVDADEIPPLTMKEIKALKRARYEDTANNFNKAYVIQNKRTGQIVEIRAASSVHAANIIGWRPRHVNLIEVKEIKESEPQNENPKVESENTAQPERAETQSQSEVENEQA